MHSVHLNEHDANQGAQSSGEFLGMTGNCGWYLLGSGGATILMVIFLWGIFGVSLLLCLLTGTMLCGLSVAYVFALKNNKPEHYDTDFFESALVEAGVLEFRFGPRSTRPLSPFAEDGAEVPAVLPEDSAAGSHQGCSHAPRRGGVGSGGVAAKPAAGEATAKPNATRGKEDPIVTREAYENLHEQLATTEELLEDALAERGED